MNDKQRLEDLIPAYALGALDSEDSAALEAHLAKDEAARDRLAEYQRLSEELLLTVPSRQAPPHLTADLRSRLAKAKSAPQPAAPQRQYRKFTIITAAVAMLLVVAGVAFVLSQLSQPATSINQRFATLQTQGNSLQVAVVPAEGQEQLTGMLVAANDSSQAVIQVVDLPRITEDQTFQLWLRGADGTVESGGVFQAAGDTTYIEIPLAGRPVNHFIGFGVSLEPAGGSPYPDRPSGPQVFFVPL